MHTLRLAQYSLGENRYKVEISLEGGSFRQSATSEFGFTLTAQDQEGVRWYLEDYPEFPYDPTPKIAARVEARMAEIGRKLFAEVFHSSDDAREIWADLRRNVSDARVEIVTEAREAASIPWELLREPKTDTCLALHAAAFVHSNFQPARPFQAPRTGEGPIRILLVICRPGGRNDVPFRSVASRLIKGLSDADRDRFQLDVLRPATFESLGKRLRWAKDKGEPYHVVHFDGHGAFVDMGDVIAAMQKKDDEREAAMRKLLAEIGVDGRHRFDGAATVYPKGKRDGKHGFLCFENPEHPENLRFVDGEEMGDLLAETGAPVLVLNACRSAHAEAPEQPETPSENAAGAADPHAQTRAFGSLAQEIVDKGTAGVVAMRYNVYVVTAAQFVADLYASLVNGHPLGKAVSLGRKALHANPAREISDDPIALQDWCVPVVYEAGPVALFPPPRTDRALNITLTDRAATPARGHLDGDLPPAPDAGFWGRDETLLALDRAFDDHGVALLHAYAGSGKTAAAAEFARWYALTGGVEGPVLFTSFEQYKPLARVLDQFGQVFGPTLEQAGVNWLARSDEERRDIALQVMRQIPVLWIWDNVEPVAGFPTGAASAWSAEEQKELGGFLRAARETRAKFLLTSRRDEQVWLAGLPIRVSLPAMPMHEREQMARALAKQHGRKLNQLKAWRPLLRFTEGNPLTLTVLVGQALRDGLSTEDQVKGFVERLSTGEAAFRDEEESQGRAKSLAASLNYGFEHAFSEEERRVLALLHFFQGFVNVATLQLMGVPEEDHALPALRGQTRESLIPLLDRAAEVGLLTALGGGYYTIHPALPWFFKGLFHRCHADDPLPARAFVEAVGALGNYYCNQYIAGNRDVIAPLTREEPNLLHARRMARANGWWLALMETMQGLRVLYDHKGRRSEWKRLVEEITPDFVDTATDAPLAGREDDWSMVTAYRVRLAQEERNWAEAERLQRVCVEWDRKRAAPFLAMAPETLDAAARHVVRTLAVSVEGLGHIQREMGGEACVGAYEQSLELFEKIGEKVGTASCAFNLGNVYMTIPAIRDLEKAGQWVARSLELQDENDRQGWAKCLGQMGFVAFERFQEARAAQKPNEEVLEYLTTALRHYHTALEMVPPDAVDDLAAKHHQLGNVYFLAGEVDSGVKHWLESIRYKENAGNFYSAGTTRFNIALSLAQSNRIPDALDYARAALRNFERYGDRAAAEIEKTKGLIAAIERL